MNSKVLVGILFVITFIVSFIIYLVLVTFINPHLDLSGTAKKEAEMVPSVEKVFQNNTGSRINLPNSNYTPISSSSTTQNQSSSSNNSTNDNTDVNNQPTTNDTIDNVSSTEPSNNQSQIEIPSNSSANDNTYTPPPPPPVVTTPPQPSVTIRRNSSNNSLNTSSPPKPTIEIKKPLAPFKPDESNSSKPTLDTMPTSGNSTTMLPKKLNRVMVGSYKSAEEAQKASENIASSNTALKPVVKNVNGKYTIQVGAFSDKKRADALANTLKSTQNTTVNSGE